MCLNYQNKDQIGSKGAQSVIKPGKKEEHKGNAEETCKNISKLWSEMDSDDQS